MKKCSNCGTPMDEHARFCTSCGAPNIPTPLKQPQNDYTKWYYIGGGIAIAVFWVVTYLFLLPKHQLSTLMISDTTAERMGDDYETIFEEENTTIEESRYTSPDEVRRLSYPMHHYFVYHKNGLWGLCNEEQEITPPMYIDYEQEEHKNYIIFERSDGTHDFYNYSKRVFEKPVTDYTIEQDESYEYIVAHSGDDIMIFETWREHILVPLKAYKKIDRMLLCRFKDGSFTFCSVDGVDFKDGLRHPRRLVCQSLNEDLIVCEELDGTQHIFKQNGWEHSTFSPEKWAIIEQEYLKLSNIEDPVFDKVYEYTTSMHTIYERLN